MQIAKLAILSSSSNIYAEDHVISLYVECLWQYQLTVIHKLWQAPLHCACSTSLTSTLSTVLLTTSFVLAPAQLDAQARVCCTITTATSNTANKPNFISKSVGLYYLIIALFIEF